MVRFVVADLSLSRFDLLFNTILVSSLISGPCCRFVVSDYFGLYVRLLFALSSCFDFIPFELVVLSFRVGLTLVSDVVFYFSLRQIYVSDQL